MSKPSSYSKNLARAAATAFGGSPKVERFWDDRRASSVDVLSCRDAPCAGVTSYATIGLSEVPLTKNGSELEVRAELVGACASVFADFPHYLSTAAFSVINSGWFVAPGVIFPDVLSMYAPSRTMKHLLFLPPFLWDQRLQTLSIEGRKVAWLLAIPVSQAELEFAETHGVPALEDRFAQAQIDIFDLARATTV